MGEELDKLSDDAKSTIELVKKLSNDDKVRPLRLDQVFVSDDTSLLMRIGDTKDKKAMESNRQGSFEKDRNS